MKSFTWDSQFPIQIFWPSVQPNFDFILISSTNQPTGFDLQVLPEGPGRGISG